MKKWAQSLILGVATLLMMESGVSADNHRSLFDDDGPGTVTRTTPLPKTPSPVVNPAASALVPTQSIPTPPPKPSPSLPTTSPTANPEQDTLPKPLSPTQRLRIPSQQAQRDANRRIDSFLKNDLAKAETPAKKVELANRLLALAEDTRDDPAVKYVLLLRGRDLATDSGGLKTIALFMQRLDQLYGGDAPTLSFETWEKVAKKIEDKDNLSLFVKWMNCWMDQLVNDDQYALAHRIGGLAVTAARRLHCLDLANATIAHMNQIEKIERQYHLAAGSLTKLAKEPNDPAANTVVGTYYCMAKGDWSKGLPMLAKGNDPVLQQLAKMELAAETTTQKVKGLADGWWNLAEKRTGLERLQLQAHACRAYQTVLPVLQGFSKGEVQSRLDEYASSTATDLPSTQIIFMSKLTPTDLWLMCGKKGLKKEDYAFGNPAEPKKTIKVNGVKPTHGITFHLTKISSVHESYQLDKKYSRFSATVALDDSTDIPNHSSLVFKVIGDGKVVWESSPIQKAGKSQRCSVLVKDIMELELVVECKGANADVWAIWLEPQLTTVKR